MQSYWYKKLSLDFFSKMFQINDDFKNSENCKKQMSSHLFSAKSWVSKMTAAALSFAEFLQSEKHKTTLCLDLLYIEDLIKKLILLARSEKSSNF